MSEESLKPAPCQLCKDLEMNSGYLPKIVCAEVLPDGFSLKVECAWCHCCGPVAINEEAAVLLWNQMQHPNALSAALARNKELEICIHLGRKLYFIGLAEGEAAQTGGYEAAKEEERLEQKANEIANALEDIVPHIVGFDVDVALAALKEDPGPVGTNSEQGPGAPEGSEEG